MDNEIRLCTWNVRTLLRPGARHELLDMLSRYEADITALQEVRLSGNDIIRDKKRKGDFYYSGMEKQGMYGVGFVVRGELRDSVMGWMPVNERMCVLRLKGAFYNTCVICAYAPTETSNLITKKQLEIQKDTFYDNLDATLEACPKHDAKYVIGDFNAKIGKESIYKGIIGMHSLHRQSTDNGCRLINFAASRNLVISSTCFPHKNIHKGTWRCNDVVNQIDHILIDSRHASNVMDVRSYRGANIDSDHYLVMAKVRARISRAKSEKSQNTKGYNIEALRSKETSEAFSRKVTQHLQNVQVDAPVEELWQQCSTAVTSAATEVLGPIRRKPKKEWYDAECTKAVQEKNAARQKWLSVKNTRGAGAILKEQYRDARRKAVNICRARKRHYEDDQMKKVEQLSRRDDTRKFYQHVKRQNEGYAPPTTFCNDASGNLLVNDDDVLERWREYFGDLLGQLMSGSSTERVESFQTSDDDQENIPPPSIAEIKMAIGKLKRNKSPGSDGIPAELIKSAGDTFVEFLQQLFQKI